MERRQLGRSGLKVAPLCLGGNVFGWTADEAASFAVLDAYVDGGGDFIDSADVYSRWAPGHSGGESETVIGKWLHARGSRVRDKIVLVTKVGSAMGDGTLERGLSRRWIMQAVDDSLRRLQTDRIDLYLAHYDDADTSYTETMRAFDDLVHAGKVRYVGASNYSAWRLTGALWASDRHNLVRYEALQPLYNLVRRDEFERDLQAMCLEHGLGVITYSSLAGGFLSGKYGRDLPLPATARAGSVQDRYMNEAGFRALDALLHVAENLGVTPGQVALAWLMSRPAVTAPIASATSVEQVQEMLGAISLNLDPRSLEILDAASDWR